jgi:hypothetical protein
VWYHLNVVVNIILEEISHLDDIWMLETVASEVIQDVDLQRHSAEPSIAMPCVDENATLGDIFDHHFPSPWFLVASQFYLAISTLPHLLENDEVVDLLLSYDLHICSDEIWRWMLERLTIA